MLLFNGSRDLKIQTTKTEGRMRRPYIVNDPGKNGALISRADNDKFKLSVIPKIGTKVVMNQFANLLVEHIEFCKEYHPDIDPLLLIEDVHSIFGAGAKANFEFGRILGRIEGMGYALLPVEYVAPKTWQGEIWTNNDKVYKPKKPSQKQRRVDTKKTSEMCYRRLFPSLDARPTERSKKFHDGIIDAVLMSEFAVRNNL